MTRKLQSMTCFLMLLCGVATAAAEKTAQVLWCTNDEIYFVYSEQKYKYGDFFEGRKVDRGWDINSENAEWTAYVPGIRRLNPTKAVFDKSFADARPKTCWGWFDNCTLLTTIEGLEYLNLSECYNTKQMFDGCTGLQSLDLRRFDMHNVQDASHMFRNCSALTTIYCDDTWDIPTNNVMFMGCTSLKGAAEYSGEHTNGDMANPTTGYFTSSTPMVVWCEGNSTLYFTSDISNTQAGGTYFGQTITDVWRGDAVTATGWNLPGWSSVREKECKVVFEKTFNAARPTSCYAWFYNFSKLTEIQGLENLNTGEVTNMNSMFMNTHKIATLDLNTFYTGKVTNASSMFQSEALTTIYCDATWNIATAEKMFINCPKLVGAVKFDSNKTDGTMANPVTGYFTGRWNVTVADGIEHCTVKIDKNKEYSGETVTITATPDENYKITAVTVTGDNGSNVEVTAGDNNTYTFTMPAEPVAVNVQTLLYRGAFAVWSANDNTLTFGNGYIPNEGDSYGDLTVTAVWRGEEVTATGTTAPGWNVDNHDKIKKVVFETTFTDVRPTSCHAWFNDCNQLAEIAGLKNLNTSKTTDMSSMFLNCLSLTSIEVNDWDMSNVTNAQTMFENCSNLTTILCGNTWDIAESENMFSGCAKLVGAVAFDSSNTDGAMANPDTGYFTWKSGIPFAAWCEGNSTLYFAAAEKVPAVGDTYDGQTVTAVWSDTDVTASGEETKWCKTVRNGLKTVVFDSSFNTVRPTSCCAWFDGCSQLSNIVGIENLNTSKVTTLEKMFQDCKTIKTIDLNGFDVSKVDDNYFMFNNCFELETIYCDNTWSTNIYSYKGTFIDCKKLRGAVAYNHDKSDGSMATPTPATLPDAGM